MDDPAFRDDMEVGRFCCPVRPVPLESVLLPGRSNRVL